MQTTTTITMTYILHGLIGAFTSIIILLANPVYSAANTAETKTITLIGKDGSRLDIGSLSLMKTEAGEKISVTFKEDKFSEHFLSMRPFKCIDGPQTLCHLPYPYKSKELITADNLMDLEYKLLFIHKGQGEYGINFWNGVYYKLKRNEDGSFEGVVWETDMDELASPPEEYSRPIGGDDLVEGAAGKHRFPRIEIK